ncbi:hypothetical protein ACT3HK_11810 [Thermolongibacillus altinsuensis]
MTDTDASDIREITKAYQEMEDVKQELIKLCVDTVQYLDEIADEIAKQKVETKKSK